MLPLTDAVPRDARWHCVEVHGVMAPLVYPRVVVPLVYPRVVALVLQGGGTRITGGGTRIIGWWHLFQGKGTYPRVVTLVLQGMALVLQGVALVLQGRWHSYFQVVALIF